jgi:dipeptidyl aminopeptidase/acylaminoacyl peptidase
MRRLAWLCLCVVVLFPPAAGRAQAPAQNRKLTLEQYLDFQEVQDPQISPDGKQIVFTRRWIDKVNDKWESALWVMNADGSRQRFLTKGSGARWSWDGTRIAYLAEGDPRGNQIFVRWMDGTENATQITHSDHSPGSIAWSPDGKSMAFTMMLPTDNKWIIRLPKKPEGAKWTPDPRIVERFVFRADRQGFLEDAYRHVFLVSATGGASRQLTSGNFNDGGENNSLSWTPDGREILFSGLRENDWETMWEESEIYALRVDDGAVRQLTHRKGPDQGPRVSPDGKVVAYTGFDASDNEYTDAKLYVMNLDGSNSRVLTPNLDRTPTNLEWAADSMGVYFVAEDKGTRNLWLAPVSGDVRQVTQGNHMLTIGSLSRTGTAVGTLSSYYKPADVVSISLSAPQPKQLTWVNDDLLRGVKLGEVEEIWYTSVDNFRVQGWIIKPPDFDPKKKYPMMLSIHGGPNAMYNVAFNFGWQEHAANGYVVLYTNPRGSTGYGTAFGNAIENDYPNKDYEDLMKGVDEVVAKGYVDTRNLFVYGCSGGGVLTSWTVGHTDRFAAASANCPVINWLSFAGSTDINLWAYHRFNKMPWEDPMLYWRHSSVAYADKVKTPTMLMTGVLDMRTPIPQTEEFYEALKLRHVPTAMVRFNDEYHGTSSKPTNFMRTQLYLRLWFEKYSRK